jgi:hypothetical protein
MEAPARIAPRDGWQDALDEAAEWRDASPAEHYRGLADACALAFAILDGHPRRKEFLDWQDPLPEESVALIERLIEQRSGQ